MTALVLLYFYNVIMKKKNLLKKKPYADPSDSAHTGSAGLASLFEKLSNHLHHRPVLSADYVPSGPRQQRAKVRLNTNTPKAMTRESPTGIQSHLDTSANVSAENALVCTVNIML